jgi:hypothetical protein
MFPEVLGIIKLGLSMRDFTPPRCLDSCYPHRAVVLWRPTQITYFRGPRPQMPWQCHDSTLWFGCQSHKVTLRQHDHPSHTETRCSLFVPSVKHPCETAVILGMGIVTMAKVQASQEATGGSL